MPEYGIMMADHFSQPDTYVVKRPQGMREWLITYTIGGQGYFLTSGRKSVCQPGDVTLLRSGTPHQYGTEKGQHWDFVWAHFSSPVVETSLLPNEELLVYHVESGLAQKRIYRAFKRVISDSRERSIYWHELCENALREILLLVAQRVNKQIDSRIEETLHLLKKQMREHVRIEVLSKAVGLSSSRLSHLFKQNTGLSIVEWLNQMRVRQAALLLEHTDRNTSEIALDVGFQNYNNFANQFRKQYGVNPSTYKTEKRVNDV